MVTVLVGDMVILWLIPSFSLYNCFQSISTIVKTLFSWQMCSQDPLIQFFYLTSKSFRLTWPGEPFQPLPSQCEIWGEGESIHTVHDPYFRIHPHWNCTVKIYILIHFELNIIYSYILHMHIFHIIYAVCIFLSTDIWHKIIIIF